MRKEERERKQTHLIAVFVPPAAIAAYGHAHSARAECLRLCSRNAAKIRGEAFLEENAVCERETKARRRGARTKSSTRAEAVSR